MKLKRIAALTAAALLAPLGVLATAEVASAHTTAITGKAVCNTDSGTYTISWNGDTDQVPAHDIAKVTTTAHTPSGSSVPGTVTSTLAPNASYSFNQTSVPGDAHSATVAVHVAWTPNGPGGDTFSADASGSITLAGNCEKPKPHTSGDVTFKEGSVACDGTSVVYTKPSYSTSGSHVIFDAPVADFGATITVHASAESGYILDGKSSFTHTYDAKPNAPDCRNKVTPVAPTVVQAVCNGPGTHTSSSITLAQNADGIKYTLSGNVVSAHIADVSAGTVKFAANLPDGWVRVSDTVATYTVTLTDPGSCVVKVVPVAPTVNQSVCTGPGTSSEFGIVLASTTGIDYTLNGLVVTATPQAGYRLPGIPGNGWSDVVGLGSSTYTVTQTDPGLCTVHTSEGVSAVGQACITTENGGGSIASGSVSVVSDDTHEATYAIGGTAISGTTNEAVGDYDVVATPVAGYTFGDAGSASDTVTEHVSVAAVGKDCRTVVTPIQPVVSEGTCDSAGIATLPTDTTGLHYFFTKQGNIGVVATKGFVLSLGDSGYVQHGHVAVFVPTIPAQLDCQAPVSPNYVTDVTCTTGQSFGPGSDSNFTYTVEGGLLVASPNEGVTAVEGNGFTFQSVGDEQRKLAIAIPDLQGPLSCVSAVAPKVEQSVCTGGDASQATVTLTAVKGIVYTLNGQEVSGKIDVNAASSLTVKAVALDGYTLTGKSSFDIKVNTVTCIIKHTVHKTLAFTGANVAPLLGTAGALLLAGMVLMFGARRRRTTEV